MWKNLKKILTITPTSKPYKNVVRVDTKWDYNICDFDECYEYFKANDFFNNKKLIWSLAYLDIHRENVKDNKYIDFHALYDVVGVCHSLWGEDVHGFIIAHSLIKLEITYYNKNGNSSNVTFGDIHKRWKNMSEEEICKEVNDVLLN